MHRLRQDPGRPGSRDRPGRLICRPDRCPRTPSAVVMYETPELLGKVVNLAELVEDDEE